MRLKGKTAVITGGSRGLGREIVGQLATEGVKIVIISRSKPDIVKCINDKNGMALWAKADVRKEKQMKEAFKLAKRKCKKIDIVINNAGVLFNKPIEKTSYKEIDLTLDTNIRGVITGCKLAKGYMEKGIIINTSSVAGIPGEGHEGLATYHASKFAIMGLTESFADEFKPKIKVYAVAPHRIATEMGKFIGNHPRDIAKTYLKILKGKINIKPGKYKIAGTRKGAKKKRPELKRKGGEKILHDCIKMKGKMIKPSEKEKKKTSKKNKKKRRTSK